MNRIEIIRFGHQRFFCVSRTRNKSKYCTNGFFRITKNPSRILNQNLSSCSREVIIQSRQRQSETKNVKFWHFYSTRKKNHFSHLQIKKFRTQESKVEKFCWKEFLTSKAFQRFFKWEEFESKTTSTSPSSSSLLLSLSSSLLLILSSSLSALPESSLSMKPPSHPGRLRGSGGWDRFTSPIELLLSLSKHWLVVLT